MKHIVCYSGGHSSGLVAIEVKRRYPNDEVILLNHNINPRYENEDIKRFKKEIADFLGLDITYANIKNIQEDWKIPSQFDVCEERKTFVNPSNRQILCTYKLKTEPFYEYLKSINTKDVIVYYGFDDIELDRIERRKTFLNDEDIQSDYPLALWHSKGSELLKSHFLKQDCKCDADFIYKSENYINSDNYTRTIYSTKEIGIEPPNSYQIWKHANCIGCLKAGQQHWYCVYVHDYETYERAKLSEEIIGHSIKDLYLKDLEPKFKRMKEVGIPANEHIDSNIFWKSAKKYLQEEVQDLFPCQCFV